MKDYYMILGLDPSAEDVVITAAYNALVSKYRLDSADIPDAEEKMKDFEEAYEVLCDPEKKADYDRRLISDRYIHSLHPSDIERSEGYPRKNDQGYQESYNPKDRSIMITIPAGEFLMGSPKDVGGAEEHPQHTVYLDEYKISRFEVTNEQFTRFVSETGYKAESSWNKFALKGRESHPVVSVTWNDAQAYCRWAGGSLPSEAQWEKAARGVDGRLYPWGNEWDKNKCNNCNTNSKEYRAARAKLYMGKGTTPVGLFADGASPYGALDMAGNVWEWCNDWYNDIYYRESPPQNPGGPLQGDISVFRGGAWNSDVATGFRCAYRVGGKRTDTGFFFGFRVCFPSKV
ncbi:MAG: SUMF1/EgtB/PvdO family nonheme iron enzyme [Vulcanimicrobiota bacterium]